MSSPQPPQPCPLLLVAPEVVPGTLAPLPVPASPCSSQHGQCQPGRSRFPSPRAHAMSQGASLQHGGLSARHEQGSLGSPWPCHPQQCQLGHTEEPSPWGSCRSRTEAAGCSASSQLPLMPARSLHPASPQSRAAGAWSPWRRGHRVPGNRGPCHGRPGTAPGTLTPPRATSPLPTGLTLPFLLCSAAGREPPAPGTAQGHKRCHPHSFPQRKRARTQLQVAPRGTHLPCHR